jgi:hypothetical protein
MSGNTGNGGERYHFGRPRGHPLPRGQSRHSQGTSWPRLPNRREENRPPSHWVCRAPQDLRVLSDRRAPLDPQDLRALSDRRAPTAPLDPRGPCRTEGPVGSKRVDGAVGPAGPEGVGPKGADGAVGPAGPPGPTGGNAIYACSRTPQRPVLTTESTCRKHCPKGAESCEPVACKLLGHLEP